MSDADKQRGFGHVPHVLPVPFFLGDLHLSSCRENLYTAAKPTNRWCWKSERHKNQYQDVMCLYDIVTILVLCLYIDFKRSMAQYSPVVKEISTIWSLCGFLLNTPACTKMVDSGTNREACARIVSWPSGSLTWVHPASTPSTVPREHSNWFALHVFGVDFVVQRCSHFWSGKYIVHRRPHWETVKPNMET